MPCCSAAGRTRSTASATTRWTGDLVAQPGLVGLDLGEREQVVDRAADPEGLGEHPLGQALGDARDRPRRGASRPAAPSAPTGVLSSWLMLATKSRRTASRRRRSVTSSITTSTPRRSPPAVERGRPGARACGAAGRTGRRPGRRSVVPVAAAAAVGGQLGDGLLDERLAVAGGEVAGGHVVAEGDRRRRRRRRRRPAGCIDSAPPSRPAHGARAALVARARSGDGRSTARWPRSSPPPTDGGRRRARASVGCARPRAVPRRPSRRAAPAPASSAARTRSRLVAGPMRLAGRRPGRARCARAASR